MGQLLFWLEAAIASVLFVALGVALQARVRDRVWRGMFGGVWWFLAYPPWVFVIVAFWAINNVYWIGGPVEPQAMSTLAGIAFVVAATLVGRRGRRPLSVVDVSVATESPDPVAPAWRSPAWKWTCIGLASLTGLMWVVSLFGPFYWPAVLWVLIMMACLVATMIVYVRGQVPSPRVSPSPSSSAWRASTWNVSHLALAWLGAVLLASMTFWNLDLAVRQEMATLKVEAGALVQSMMSPPVPDSQNAAPLYRQANEILIAQQGTGQPWSEMVDAWLFPNKGEGEFDPNNQEMLEFLHKQKPVLGLVRKASQMPGYDTGNHYIPLSIETLMPDLHHMRGLGKLLCLSAQAAAHRGDMTQAMEDISTALAMSEHCLADPTLIATLTAVAIDDLASRALQYAFENGPVTVESLDALALNPSVSYMRACRRSMRMESAGQLSIFTMEDFSSAMSATQTPGPREYIVRNMAHPYRVFFWRADLEVNRQWARMQDMHYHLLLSGRPEEIARTWAAMKQVDSARTLQELRSAGYSGLLAFIMTPSLSGFAERAAMADANRRLMLTAVAMWRYRLAEGAFPEELTQLAPEYLLAAPVDPFTGTSMKLAVSDDGDVTIYSVGPDLKDNGGVPYDRKMRTGDIVLTVGRNE
ncbi:MAG: hypothetical protein FWE88_08850 [Phycisphaerae bacterium]|nr:hypothetical protein [Phycisphaerae bacterium]